MKFTYLLMIMVVLGLSTSCNDEDDQDVPSSSFTVTIENVFSARDYFQTGIYTTPQGSAEAGVIVGGQSYEFTFHAGPGHRLSFATMFVQSNDLFYGPAENGIELFDGSGNPISGDITDQLYLWDAGTEVNEEPYAGENQAPRQSGPNTGTDENGMVKKIGDVDDGFDYPVTSDIIQVMITSGDNNMFTVNILNVSTGDVPSPLAPGVFVIHGADQNPLFSEGTVDFGDGLESLAEDGGVDDLNSVLSSSTGYFSPLAPGAFVVHSAGTSPMFMSGSPDAGEGLEALAEDGNPSGLAGALSVKDGVVESGAFDTPVDGSGPGVILPGGQYQFSFTASEGDLLNLATMLVQSNDLFYAFEAGGIELFDNGSPITDDLTSQLSLWDAGTEVNEYPGAGANQAPRQSGANVGENENGNVMVVNDGFTYPSVSDAIKVTISIN